MKQNPRVSPRLQNLPKLHKVHLVLRLLHTEGDNYRTRSCLLTSYTGLHACICMLAARVIPWFYQFVSHCLSFRSEHYLITYLAQGWLMHNLQKHRYAPFHLIIPRMFLSYLIYQPWLISTCSYSAPLWVSKQTYILPMFSLQPIKVSFKD